MGAAHNSRRSTRWQGIIGVAIAAAGLAFAVQALQSADFNDILDPKRPLLLVVLPIAAGASMGLVGFAWWLLVRVTGGRAGMLETLGAYYPGQLGKYVPGGFWPILGRGELLYRRGVKRTSAYTSVMLSLIFTYAAAGVVGLPALVRSLWDAGVLAQAFATALAFTLVAVAVHPAVFRAVTSLLARLLRRDIGVDPPRWSVSVGIIAVCSVAWLAIGVTTALVGTAYGIDMEPGGLISATALSWLAGFLFIPVPGGIGVREAVFIAAAPGITESGAALVALGARLVFIVGDLLAAAIVVGAAALRRET